MKKGHRLQALVYSLIISLLLPVTCNLSPVYAADSTPSADIRAKLEELKKEIASKAAQIKQQINRKLNDKAYVGSVKSTSDTSITLAADSGPRIVSINQDTVFESEIKSKKKFSQATVSTEDYLAALGDTDETGVLTAKKIVLLKPNDTPKTYLWGQIISISDKLITLRTNDFKNIAATLPTTDEAKLNDFVILTGNKNKNDIFEAGFVYVIPQGEFIKPKKVVYPEPNRGATPAAKQATKPAVKPASR